MDKTLKEARDAHRKRTGHTDIMVGMNFITCFACNRHAHLGGEKDLIQHDGKYVEVNYIEAHEF